MLPIDLDGIMHAKGRDFIKQFEILEWRYVACGLSGDMLKNFKELTAEGYLAKRQN